ncbi:MAG: hypothetical protein ACI9XU_000433 [Arenicella sp.]|jgi:hypothetical protein
MVVIGLFFASDANSKLIVIAIVDDAFEVDDSYLKGLLWNNPREIVNNRKDDDNNGYIDDVIGWDVSDQDQNVAAPVSRRQEFSHGTAMAKLIVSSIRESLGEMDEYPIKIMPIKAVADRAQQLNLVDGYNGLRYAIENNADLINLSWGGGIPTKSDMQVLSFAEQSESIVIASLGTYPQKDESMPAGHATVIGVVGVDEENKLFSSNFGKEADIAALARHTVYEEEYEGVSVSTALVTATMALMKLKKPSATKQELMHCLQTTAKPVDIFNAERAGQLGAGLIAKKEAIACIAEYDEKSSSVRDEPMFVKQPEGVLRYRHTGKPKQASLSWSINPEGRYQGIEIKPYVEGLPKRSTLEVKEAGGTSKVFWSGLLSELPATIFSEDSNVAIKLNVDSKSSFNFVTGFATKNIIFSEQFCKDNLEIVFDADSAPYLLEDGSGDFDYAGESDCKWLFVPTEGFNLKFEFVQIDTELHVDGIHFFRGDTTSQTNFLMKVTGAKLPPPIIIERDPVTVWFTSDIPNPGQGFKLRVSQVQNLQREA